MKIILILSLLPYLMFSQLSSGNNIQDLFMEDQLEKLGSMNELSTINIPFSSKLNPDYYLIGPGDSFFMKILPFQAKEEILKIDPEGNLILPRSYGMINLYGNSITEARKIIAEKLDKEQENIIFSLYKPRSVIIRIKGDVKNENVYTLPATFKISDAINYANNPSDRQVLTNIAQLQNINDYSNKLLKEELKSDNPVLLQNIFQERNIIITGVDDTRIVDIASARFGFPERNPHIREGMEIIVPKMDEYTNYYSVSGAFLRPANISHRNGDNAELAIKLAGGLSPNADLNKVFLHLPDGTETKLKFDENGNIGEFNPEINSGTKIIAHFKEEHKKGDIGLVTVEGEVAFPGSFAIKPGETTLKQIIDKAGGTKSTACLSLGKILNFKEFKDKDFILQQEVLENLKYFNLSIEDTVFINMEYRLSKPRVSVNFEKALNSNNDDFYLQDGDLISIPECPSRTMVMGRVKNPGYIEFQGGKHPSWYINMAGGLVESADKGRLRVIRGGTSIWEEVDKNTVIMPGDIVYVPSEIIVSKVIQTQEYAALAGILGAIGAIGIFIIQVVNLVGN